MYPADRPVLGEPALARGLVNLLSAIPALRSGDPLEDGRADPAAKALSRIPVSHHLIIGGQENRLAAGPVPRMLSCK